ncbi:MAG TPA: hypothetical protein VIR27_06465 [Mycobacteriales bacterium]
MSRHAAPQSDQAEARSSNLGAAVVAAALTVALVLPPQAGRIGVVAALAVVQVLLVYAWVVGTAMPGRIGALLLGIGTALACDALVYRFPHEGLGPIMYAYAGTFVLAIVHQLSRGVVRVRVTESVAHVCLLSAGAVALTGYLAVQNAVGATLLSAAVSATGLAVVAGLLVDTVLPVPRFDTGVDHGLLGVLAATAVGAGVGWLRIGQAGLSTDPVVGAVFGGGLGLLAALVGIGVAYVCESASPRRAPFGGLTLPYLRAALPFALTAPVAFVLGSAVGG